MNVFHVFPTCIFQSVLGWEIYYKNIFFLMLYFIPEDDMALRKVIIWTSYTCLSVYALLPFWDNGFRKLVLLWICDMSVYILGDVTFKNKYVFDILIQTFHSRDSSHRIKVKRHRSKMVHSDSYWWAKLYRVYELALWTIIFYLIL